jgi:electron transfer flavoprotein alpha subunit
MEYWVLIESGSMAEWGLLEHCAALTDTGGETGALLREGLEPAAAFARGAKKVYVLHGEADARQAGEQIARLAQTHSPDAILCTADNRGRMTAAVTAALLKTGLAADCTCVSRRDDGLLLMTRPTFGGSLLADIVCPRHRPQMATVRPGIYLPGDMTEAGTDGPIIPVGPPERQADAVLVTRMTKNVQNLSTAQIIVAGGKGVGSQEGFVLLEKLAAAIGASVGASRSAVNAGYAPYDRQIGLTGQVVRPRVYLAFGISGSVQHLVGMEKSDLVIAINADPKAPIFEYADYGIIADWRETAQALLQQFSQ